MGTTADTEFTIFVAGDAIITQPWSQIREERFLKLIEAIRAADTAIVNLELVLTNYKGFPQADSGGTHLSVRPVIAHDLIWAGIDMLGNANNHAFDYGSIGVTETLDSAAKAGLVLAGAGLDLQSARQPGYFNHPKGSVALVSMASTFIRYGVAGKSRPELHGRPGVNPLRVLNDGKVIRLFSEVQRNLLDRLARWGISLRGIEVRTINEEDKAENLQSIQMAERTANFVVVSLHSHNPGVWLEDFAHEAIEAGADLFFTHGTHTISGIEIYKGNPIFYGLGDFVYQSEQVENLPAEDYDKYGLGLDAKPKDYYNALMSTEAGNFFARLEIWQGIAATVTFGGNKVKRIQIIPVDLGFGHPIPRRGRPELADGVLGKRIIDTVNESSQRFGTKVDYMPDAGVGIVALSHK